MAYPTLPFVEGIELGKIEEAIVFLQGYGYRVTPPPPSVASVTRIVDVIELFYSTMAYYHPKRRMHYAASVADRKVISSLLASRQSTGLSRKKAYAEVCSMIKALFKYESKLCLDSPIASVRILSSSWIIDRLLVFLNTEDKAEEEAAFHKVSSGFSSRYVQSKEYLDKVSKSLHSIHERVVKNGSKEREAHAAHIPNSKGRTSRD